MKGLTKPQKSKPFKLRAGAAFPNSPGYSRGTGKGSPCACTPVTSSDTSQEAPLNIPPWFPSNLTILKPVLVLGCCPKC